MKIETLLEMPDAALVPVGAIRKALEERISERVSVAAEREMTIQMWKEIVDLYEDRACQIENFVTPARGRTTPDDGA